MNRMDQFFNLPSYYSNLRTKRLGRPCIYLDQVDSTIDVACKEKPDTIVLARQQLKGRGQKGHTWQSPNGCAMGSLRVLCQKVSYLSTRLCFLQHILVLAAAKTLENIDSNKLGKNRLRLKWPNDIVYKGIDDKHSMKIGGVLVHTKDCIDDYDITMSFGLNVFNQKPTTCVSDIVGPSKKISIDSIVADMMNHLESYIFDLDEEKFLELKSDYEQRSIHMNKFVEDELNGRVKVLELNDEGYLEGERCSDHRRCVITKILSYDW